MPSKEKRKKKKVFKCEALYLYLSSQVREKIEGITVLNYDLYEKITFPDNKKIRITVEEL